MRTFLALSMADYGKPFERKCLDMLKSFDNFSFDYGDYIGTDNNNDSCISASEINKRITEEDKKKGFRYIEENYFFKEIDKSDIVVGVYNARSKQYTIGVIVEMEYALIKGKTVYEIDNGFLCPIDVHNGIGKHYSDIAYRIHGLEVIRIKDKYKELLTDKWWLR